MQIGINLSITGTIVLSPPAVEEPGETLGPELWPQPTFDDSTGLTLQRSAVVDGQWQSNGSELVAACQAMLSEGSMNVGDVFEYSFEIIAVADFNSIALNIGGQQAEDGQAPGTYVGRFTMESVNSQALRFTTPNNGVNILDNVSIKKVIS